MNSYQRMLRLRGFVKRRLEHILFASWVKSVLSVSRDATVAQLVYSPIRTGDWSTAEGITPFVISNVLVSRQADGSKMVASRASGSGLVVEIGTNTQIFRNYVPGYDLIVAFMCTSEMINQKGITTLNIAYDGKPMYDVSGSMYNADGFRGKRAYAYIAPNIDVSKIAPGTEECPVVTYSNNVNQAGDVDIADVQTIANIRAGRVPLAGNEVKWLLADIDRSGIVDNADQLALMRALNK